MKRVLVGPRAVADAVRARPGAIVVVYAAPGARRAHKGLLEEIGGRGVRIEERGRVELDALACGERHEGIAAIAGEYRYAELEHALSVAGEAPVIVALDEITDPHNLGAIVRSAVAFGAAAVITLKDRAAPVTPAVVRASAGTTEHAKIVRVTNLARTLHELEERELQIVGLAGDGESEIDRLPAAPRGRVIVIGSEGSGLRPLVRKQCALLARIPIAGPVESLNASVAAAIALFCVSRANESGSVLRPRG